MICVNCYLEDEIVMNNINGRCDRCNGLLYAEKEDLDVDVVKMAMAQVENECKLYVTRVNKANGWFDESRSFGDEVALLHSEVSEMLEAYRAWGLQDATISFENGTAELPDTSPVKPEGVGSEVADVFIRLMDFCYRHNIDLTMEFYRKMAYNETRGYKHGNKKL